MRIAVRSNAEERPTTNSSKSAPSRRILTPSTTTEHSTRLPRAVPDRPLLPTGSPDHLRRAANGSGSATTCGTSRSTPSRSHSQRNPGRPITGMIGRTHRGPLARRNAGVSPARPGPRTAQEPIVRTVSSIRRDGRRHVRPESEPGLTCYFRVEAGVVCRCAETARVTPSEPYGSEGSCRARGSAEPEAAYGRRVLSGGPLESESCRLIYGSTLGAVGLGSPRSGRLELR